MKRAGISLVALVITIIVLIILTGAVIITGINAPTQANLAVFLNNISTMQDVVSLKMMSNMVDYATEGNTSLFKFVGVVNGYTEQMARDGIAPTFAVVENKANGKEVASLDPILLSSVKISAEELSKFYIEPTGAIIHEGYILGDIKYYTAKEMVESIPPLPIATVVQVGDFVNYDAGTWDSSVDTTKITSSGGTVTWSSVLTKTQGQFGGFIDGQSRNTNSTPNWGVSTYSGWRVWDIEGGIVTLICAGHPESYCHRYTCNESTLSILRNRDCSMYVNNYATRAEILTGEQALAWYNKYFDPDYESMSAWDQKTFPTTEPIDVLYTNATYYVVTPGNSDRLYHTPSNFMRYDGCDQSYGIRFLVYLKSDVFVEAGTGDGSVGNPWRIVE